MREDCDVFNPKGTGYSTRVWEPWSPLVGCLGMYRYKWRASPVTRSKEDKHVVLEWRKREREREEGREGPGVGRKKGGGVLFLHNYVIQ